MNNKLKTALRKTLGLSREYYLRQLFFGALIAAVVFALSGGELRIGTSLFMVISTVLYPFSRFVYESVVGFIMGDNVFILSAVMLMLVKFITMFFCFVMAIFIAPIGMLYLYIYHSKNTRANSTK